MTSTLPGLDRDAIVIKRPSAAVDAEGNPTLALTTVVSTVGTWGTPSYRDIVRAQAASQTVDAVVATASAAGEVGDRIEARGAAWLVVTKADTRIHWRYGLRRAE